MKKNLIILRCGRSSLHPLWTQSQDTNWDLVVCPYQEIEDKRFETRLIPGQKWTGLAEILRDNFWKKYEFIWLPDDDILMNEKDINRFFDLCHQFSIQLASPALTHDSYFFHPLTLANKSFSRRKTNFVEIMMPCFSRDFLEKTRFTFDFTKTGFGVLLDSIWPYMADFQGVHIFDEVEVKHTRPVTPRHDAAISADMRFARGFDVDFPLKTLEGVGHDGTVYIDGDGDFFLRLLEGYRALNETAPDFAKKLLLHQLAAFSPRTDPNIKARLDYATRRPRLGHKALSYNRPSLVSSVSRWSAYPDPALEASGGNDGLINGHCGFHTAEEVNPWWQVDLGSEQEIHVIDVYNRLDYPMRCVDMAVLISQEGAIWLEAARKNNGRPFGGADGHPCVVKFDPPISARFVRIQMLGRNFLHLDQVEVYGDCPERAALLP